jgi:prephenate dehydrogenase
MIIGPAKFGLKNRKTPVCRQRFERKILKFQQMTIIGVGLIGGSLARAVKEKRLVAQIVGAGRSQKNLAKALALGVVDRIETDHREAVQGSDIVVVCTPVQAAVDVVRDIFPAMKPTAILTDVGSVKGPFVRAIEEMNLDTIRFVGGHPIAGAEKSGVEASMSTLFQNHRTILTPTASSSPDAVDALKALWESVGAHVDIIEPERHDRILADISHLPHLVAYVLVNLALDGGGVPYAAGGFRDFTRIASSNPEMWRDISLDNKEALLNSLTAFEKSLSDLRRAVEVQDGEALELTYRKAKEGRDDWLRERGWL